MKALSTSVILRNILLFVTATVLSLLLWAVIRFLLLALISFQTNVWVADAPIWWPIDYVVLPYALAIGFTACFAPKLCEKLAPWVSHF